ncbi:ATP-binding protein [Crenothrix polyspora]|uniref:Putative transcriptional regulator n=1 Tax=Crenothrix polyspora TaxID=360316 RepID=A0A1R4H8G6_9GAMM|nr:ATP-binding protein [Crenothrix polyspora]SJM92476.1 putative transcriptional regulator [Crenothrix polyspora]
MTVERTNDYLLSLLNELRNLPQETEWVEFKHNNAEPEEIGEYLSALANSATLLGKVTAWLVWGVDNNSHAVIGTTFDPTHAKIGNEELESWLLRSLAPKINFRFHTMIMDEMPVVLLEISAAFRHPVQFKGTEFMRIGSYKKRLKDFPEKERELWRVFDQTPFEREIAAENVSADDVLRLLDYPGYFDLLNLPLPEGRANILAALAADELIIAEEAGKWNISNLGAILFAKKLTDFRTLKRKAVRVILYKGESRVQTIREQEGTKGYATGFEGLIGFVTNLLPSNEVIGQAFRKEVPMFPELAIRELVANAVIHQDFYATGTAPMIELFSNRMEITNPGLPLVKTDRFLDSPPKSRNEALASFMRRIGVCEERGSGVDKVVAETELYQLPAPLFESTDEHTRVILFAHRELKDMDINDRIRASYLHACLRYVQRNFMTNTTLRERFGIDTKNSAMASRIIKETLSAGLIRCHDETVGNKARKYLPWWA